MTKRNFRIKLDNDNRAVSYRNIEVNVDAVFDYKVTPKGVKTMIRQYLKSTNKKIYEYPISFKYYKKSNGLDVKITGISGDEIRELLPKLEQFTSGNVFRDVKENYKITFDLRSLVIFNETPNANQPKTPAPAPAPQSSSDLPKLESIEIIYNGGSPNYSNSVVRKWADFQSILQDIYNNGDYKLGNYDKVKVEIKWTNGKKIIDRIDIGDAENDFNPKIEYIGYYISKQGTAWYESNFDNRPSPEDRDSVSWTDEVDEDAPSPAKAKNPLEDITIRNFQNNEYKVFTKWEDADEFLEEQYNQMPEDDKWKFKIMVVWQGGARLTEIITLGNESKEYNVPTENLGVYLYNIDGDNSWNEQKDELQWDDEDVTPQPENEPDEQPDEQPDTQPQQPQQPNMKNNYILSQDQFETIYGADWREVEKLDWIDELDFLFNHCLTDMEQSLIKSGANLSIEIDGLDYTISNEATTLACYHDYDDLSAEEIDEIIDGLQVFTEIGTGVSEERKNAYELMENLKLFKKHNK